MIGPEQKGLYLPQFQPEIRYKATSNSPMVVAQCTGKILKLFQYGALKNDTEIAFKYLQNHTIPYLNAAREGCEKNGEVVGTETAEAFGYTRAVFAYMPRLRWDQILPNGFSKKGMLAPPDNNQEFLERTDELKNELARITCGETKPRQSLRNGLSFLRMHAFFAAALAIPMHELTTQKEINEIQEEKTQTLKKPQKEKSIQELLDGIPVFFTVREANSKKERRKRKQEAWRDVLRAIEIVQQRRNSER